MAMKVLRLHPGANEPHADALIHRVTHWMLSLGRPLGLRESWRLGDYAPHLGALVPVSGVVREQLMIREELD